MQKTRACRGLARRDETCRPARPRRHRRCRRQRRARSAQVEPTSAVQMTVVRQLQRKAIQSKGSVMCAWQDSGGDMHLTLLEGASVVSQPEGWAISLLKSIAVG